MEIDKEKLKDILRKLSEHIPYTNDYHSEDFIELNEMIGNL